jgi:hypothetical protein
MNSYDRGWCINLFNDLIKMPIARPFLRPVDPIADGAPDYHDVIADPVDFSAIGSKLRAKRYDSPAAFVSDLQLLCANAIEYNGADSLLADFARDLRKHFLWEFSCKCKSARDEWARDLAAAVHRLAELTDACPRPGKHT